ncbi:MAG: hypothetical protein ACYS3N_06675 [Planctomycetota bacterium]
MFLIIYSRLNMTTLLFGKTLGYTDKLSHINMILNFFKKNNYLSCYTYVTDKSDHCVLKLDAKPQKSYKIDTFIFIRILNPITH